MMTENNKWELMELIRNQICKDKSRLRFAIKQNKDFPVLKEIEAKLVEREKTLKRLLLTFI